MEFPLHISTVAQEIFKYARILKLPKMPKA